MTQWFFLFHSLRVTNRIFLDNLIMLSILKEGGNKRKIVLPSVLSATTRYCVLRNLKLFGNVYDFSFVICCFVRVQWLLWKWNFGVFGSDRIYFPAGYPRERHTLSLLIARKFRKTVLRFVRPEKESCGFCFWLVLLLYIVSRKRCYSFMLTVKEMFYA